MEIFSACLRPNKAGAILVRIGQLCSCSVQVQSNSYHFYRNTVNQEKESQINITKQEWIKTAKLTPTTRTVYMRLFIGTISVDTGKLTEVRF